MSVDTLEDEVEGKAAFHLRMRSRGISDRRILRAFELVPRHAFLPPHLRHFASRDVAVPIGCGQTMQAPWLIARMIQALDVEPGHRVLEIGSGTGHATALLAHLGAEVLGVERFRTLAEAAHKRLAAFDLRNAAVVWADGLSLLPSVGLFDRVLVHGVLPAGIAGRLVRATSAGGLVYGRMGVDGQAAVRLAEGTGGLVETIVCDCRLQRMQPGLSAML